MFASLDGWLDKLIDERIDPVLESDAIEVVHHILWSNYSLLRLISEQCNDTLAILQRDSVVTQHRSIDEMRLAFRDQLFQSLCMIDFIEDTVALDNAEHDKQMDLRDKLLSIANHLRYHLEELEVDEFA